MKYCPPVRAMLANRRFQRTLSAFAPLSERIVLHGRKLGTQLGVGIETDEDRRLSKLLQSPKGILDWVAVPNFLDMRP